VAWFASALGVWVASQIVRLDQTDPMAWIICDYAGRVGALTVLVAIPAARAVAFEKRHAKLAGWKLADWILTFVLFAGLFCRALSSSGLGGLGRLGRYPTLHGWVRVLDIVLGLALVAYSEEILFRRCARHILRVKLGDGFLMVITTAVIFAAAHWTFGFVNIVTAGCIGIVAMIFYQKSEAIWPVVVAHYLTDIVAFS
jgi:membrane protease YdiL (CAAX protease family)